MGLEDDDNITSDAFVKIYMKELIDSLPDDIHKHVNESYVSCGSDTASTMYAFTHGDKAFTILDGTIFPFYTISVFGNGSAYRRTHCTLYGIGKRMKSIIRKHKQWQKALTLQNEITALKIQEK